MRAWLCLIGVMLVSAWSQPLTAAEPSDLRLLLIGGGTRAEAYATFLKEHFAEVETVTRDAFTPKQADGFDVVLLDWPQSESARMARETGTSPLGERAKWNKPTVLLGSAGLNLAVVWETNGGSGCTCMDPVAYDLRDHEIFDKPHKIDRTTTTIPMPEDFASELEGDTIEVIPLVENMDRQWHPGWCTYARYFDQNPDVEVFCGGVNHKTPTAAGMWRQGNLLHFGFDQTPDDLNERGDQMLLNAIAYISKFTEDKPLGIRPSVFAGEPVSRPRETPGRWLRLHPVEWTLNIFDEPTQEMLKSKKDQEAMIAWCDENSKYFHPAGGAALGIDEELKSLGFAFDSPKFFPTVIADLQGDAAQQQRARTLLARYATNIGPGADASAEAWQTWYQENEPYLFGLDTGDYQWYIDPLAKKRGMPSAELRGPARADVKR